MIRILARFLRWLADLLDPETQPQAPCSFHENAIDHVEIKAMEPVTSSQDPLPGSIWVGEDFDPEWHPPLRIHGGIYL